PSGYEKYGRRFLRTWTTCIGPGQNHFTTVRYCPQVTVVDRSDGTYLVHETPPNSGHNPWSPLRYGTNPVRSIGPMVPGLGAAPRKLRPTTRPAVALREFPVGRWALMRVKHEMHAELRQAGFTGGSH